MGVANAKVGVASKFCARFLFIRTPLSKILGTDHRNANKRGERHYPGICMATAILLKERNRGIQAFLSLVLFSSRVQKMCVSMCQTEERERGREKEGEREREREREGERVREREYTTITQLTGVYTA